MPTQVQNLNNIEKALKEYYLPLWNNLLNTEPSIILSKIKKKPLKSHQIVASAPIGQSGGFGFSSEGAPTPAPGAVRFERFKEVTKDMYCNINISIKATKLTGSESSMADALKTEVEAAYNTAKWNVGRTLFGNGSGILTATTGVAGNTVTVANTQNVMEGLTIDIFAGTPSPTSIPTATERRIIAVDRTAKTLTIDGAAVTAAAGFITIQGSYNKEITGFNSIFDNGVTTLYGVSKADNPVIKPMVVNANGEIDDILITRALRDVYEYKNSNIDMILCGNNAYDAYVEYLRTTNQRIESRYVPVGGFNAIKFVFSNREVYIANERFIPLNEMWCFDTSTFEFHTFEWEFATLQGGSIFNLIPRTSVYHALLANYGNLVCSNPGGCVRIHNLPNPTV